MVLQAHRKHRRKLSSPLLLAVIALFVDFGIAMVDSMWSLYVDSFVHNEAIVGTIIGLMTLISVLFFFFSAPIIERYPETKIWIFSMLGAVIGYVGFALTKDFTLFLFIAVGVVAASVLRRSSFGIIVRDSTPIREIGEEEGLVYTLMNIGWLIGPILGGMVLAQWGFQPLFLIAGVLLLMGLIIFRVSRMKDIEHHTKDDATIRGSLRNLRDFFQDKERIKTYVLSGGISLYWGIIFVYMPLFIVKEGFSGTIVGLFLGVAAVPLVLFEYIIGKKADEKGFRQFFVVGFSILAVCSFLAFLFGSITSAMIFLVFASVGAACLEGTTESYFFKITKKSEEEKYYGPYNTCDDIFGTLGKLSGAGILFFLPFQYVFLMLSCFMLVFAIVAFRLKESRQHMNF